MPGGAVGEPFMQQNFCSCSQHAMALVDEPLYPLALTVRQVEPPDQLDRRDPWHQRGAGCIETTAAQHSYECSVSEPKRAAQSVCVDLHETSARGSGAATRFTTHGLPRLVCDVVIDT